MTLKAVLDTLDGLSEAVAALYVKGDDGKFKLDVEGLVPKDKVDEFRNNNVQLMKQLEAFKDVDPVKYAEMLKTAQEIENEELLKKGDVDKVIENRVAQMRTQYDADIDKLTKQNQAAQSQLQVLLVDNAVRDAAVKSGVQPSAVDDVLLRARTSFVVKDGEAVAQDSNGNIIYGKDGVTPMSVIEWTSGLKSTAPHLFPPSQGGGAPGSSKSPGQDMSRLSATQKISEGLSEL